MGFISNLFKGNRKHEKTVIDGCVAHKSDAHRKHLEHIHLEGEHTATVFIYDGRPLKGVKNGHKLKLEALPGSVSLTSTLTGGTWNSIKDGGFAVGYSGVPVGFMNSSCKEITELLRRGHTVTISARCKGMYGEGIPDIEALLPPWREIRALIDPVLKAKLEGLIIEYNVDEDKYKGDLRTLKKKKIEATITLLPRKKGSSAKQHIAIVSNKDGKLVDELAATKPVYKRLIEYVGKSVVVTVEARQSIIEEGSFYYHFEVDTRHAENVE